MNYDAREGSLLLQNKKQNHLLFCYMFKELQILSHVFALL